MQYSLDEICLLPSATPTDILSRSEVDPYDGMDNLPIFVAPMTSVIDENNYEVFNHARIYPIIPRGVNVNPLYIWKAYSLKETINMVEEKKFTNQDYVLIDLANGHMRVIYELVKKMKELWPNIQVMVGNIANPEMYRECCRAGVDFCRVGVGGSNVCITSVLTGIHASHHWMIEGIKKIQQEIINARLDWKLTKTIADGGINSIDKAIKCLALGYDYVMMGKCFAQCEEACGETKSFTTHQYPDLNTANEVIVKSRKYYGMASEQGQKDISGGVCKNPEGIESWVIVNTNLKEFLTKFEAALRSSMSYTGARTLNQFKKTKWDIMSINTFKSYHDGK